MHPPRVFALAALWLMLALSSSIASAAIAPTTNKAKPSAAPAPAQSTEDKAARNKRIDARRAQLAQEIATQQSIMDRYEKQSSFKKDSVMPRISEEQYERAKAARDKAQQERDQLAAQLLN